MEFCGFPQTTESAMQLGKKTMIFLFLFFTGALTAITVKGDQDVYRGTYYKTGHSITVDQVVTGSLFLIGSSIEVQSSVFGNVFLIGNDVKIYGDIGKSAWIIADKVTIEGAVGNNVKIIAREVNIESSALIKGKLSIVAENVDLRGRVGRNASIWAYELDVSNRIEGNLNAHVTKLTLTSNAYIGGNISYQSGPDVNISGRATIAGREIISSRSNFWESMGLKEVWFGSAILGKIMNYIYTFVAALILFPLFPTFIKKQVSVLNNHWWHALWCGCIAFFVIPAISIVLLMTVLGIPLGLALGSLCFIVFFLAKITPIMSVSQRIARNRGWKLRPLSLFALGLLCYLILTLIPILGILLSLAATFFGLGTFFIFRHVKKREAK
jgi:cytoskeletal protein CcmA (bactofilin family)